MYSLTLALVFRDENLSQLDSTKQTNKTALNFNDIKRWAQGWSLGWIHDNSAPFFIEFFLFYFCGQVSEKVPHYMDIVSHFNRDPRSEGLKMKAQRKWWMNVLFGQFICSADFCVTYTCVLSLLEHRGKSRGVPNDRYLASYVPLVTGGKVYLLIDSRAPSPIVGKSHFLGAYVEGYMIMETHVNSLYTFEIIKDLQYIFFFISTVIIL